jgi:hypothetical protein
VGGLEDRLCSIEGELSRLTTMLKTSSQRSSLDLAADDDSLDDVLANGPLREEASSALPADRHIVRSPGDDHRYHGPCTLFALCNEFSGILEQQMQPSSRDESLSTQQEYRTRVETIQGALARMCLEAGMEDSFDLQSEQVPIRLPPKHFLLMLQDQFFQQADYATDIFVQSSFSANVERIYSQPFNNANEAWAICFNTIILILLGSETSDQGNDPITRSQFALPFLLTVRTALSNPRVLMAPKLINVQALALLVSLYFPDH